MDKTNTLSRRGHNYRSQPIRADFDLFDEVMNNHYEAQTNPAGGIPLCIAENTLGWPALRDRLQQIAAEEPAPEWVASYASTLGHEGLRRPLARFLSKYLGGNDLNWENLAISSGATATIEMTAFLLGDPGDVAVIPGPAYSVYSGDIGKRAGMERYDLHLPAPEGHPGTYRLGTSDLDRAYAELGDRFRMLILTQPNNPTGQVFTEDQIYAAVTWCEERKIHCVVNEIYALSLVDQDHPALLRDYEQRQWFVSCLPQLQERASGYFHWWYSFSKDFGISGLRLGALYTRNEQLLEAYANAAAPSVASNYTQWLLGELLRGDEWVISWMRKERSLTESYLIVVGALRELGIDYSPAVGSLFVWFDLSARLRADTDEAWEQLWREIYDATGVLLTYPLGMGGRRRGWMRLVYTCVPPATLREAMRRLAAYWKS